MLEQQTHLVQLRFQAGTNETFASFSNIDYAMSILTGGGTGAQGDLVDMTDNISGTGSNTVTITDSKY